jgi:hypothetical protein
MDSGLLYVGRGFLPDVPARDLTAAEVELYGGAQILIKSGLYRRPQPAAGEAKPKPKRGKR